MKVLNLRCSHDHRFEGWFSSVDEFQSQMDRGLLECPLCADKGISRLPSAPYFSVGKSRSLEPVVTAPEAGSSTPATPEAMTLQSMWLRAVQHVMAHTDDVGDRFAEEARRIHYGEVEERAIRGQATREDAQALQEEGIEVMPLPMPEAIKGPLQ